MQKLKIGIFYFALLFCLIYNPTPLYAHKSWSLHVADMMEVFGFEKGQPKLEDWMKFISSDMIDKHNPFYSQLCERHPGFKCNHRLLFHWGYNANPWNNALEKKISAYCKLKNIDIDSTIRVFKQEIKDEQKRRNRLINGKTEALFGFAHGGTDAKFAEFFASTAYNVHLIGDYTSDNSDLEGLQKLEDIIGLIVIELRKLDDKLAIPIIKEITVINKEIPSSSPQKKADMIMACLKKNVPYFIRYAREGSIYRRLSNKGFRFVEI